MKIRAITKGKNRKTIEYCVYFNNGKQLKIRTKDNYQGTSTWGNYFGINDLDIENKKILGAKVINFSDLPPIIKSHIEKVLYEKNKKR